MANDPDPNRLRALEARLAQAKPDEQPSHSTLGEAHAKGHIAWRMVIELVVGLLIGFGMGYGVDALLGTQPWLMLIFTLLGFVAGIKTMIRSAQELQDDGAGADPQTGDRDGQ